MSSTRTPVRTGPDVYETQCGGMGTLPAPRFEEQVCISISCCGEAMRFGNLSLREAGAPNTTLGYECKKCFRRVAVVDCWPTPSAADLEAIDQTP